MLISKPELVVISGGQIGADIAGLLAAEACGIKTGGLMPKGRRTLLGALDLETFNRLNLREDTSSGYPARTEKNVVASDGTIRLAHSWYSPGERATQRFLIKHRRPRFDVELRRNENGEWSPYGFGSVLERAFAKTAAAWIKDNEISTLNIAGNADSTIEPCVRRFLTLVFQHYKTLTP